MYKQLIIIPSVILMTGITGCVTPLATQSGRPEVYIQRDPAQVKNALLTVMSANGYAPLSDGVNTLAFAKKVENNGALVAAMLVSAIGGRDTMITEPPDMIVRFTLVPWGTNGTHVYGFTSVSTQNTFGQTQSFDVSQARAGQDIQRMLEQLAATAKLKPGPSDPVPHRS